MDLELLAKSASKLFTLPEICMKIQDVIYDPSSSASDIAELIAIDPSLSARLLKIANSSFYNFPSQIDDLGRAINLIGTEDLYNLALATCTTDSFSSLHESNNIDLATYWKHSVLTGLIGRNLAQHCGMRHSEKLFLAGLFHNLGQLVVLEQLPDDFIKIAALINAEDAPWDIEKEILGFTYAEVSAELLQCWKMPENILELVKTQHDPSKCTEPNFAAIVHIASRSASQLEFGNSSGFDFNNTILTEAWETTGIDKVTVHSAISLAEINCQTMISAMAGKQDIAA